MIIDQAVTDSFALYRGDCIEVLPSLPAESVHYSIYSPPFASLYTYTDSAHDMGNCKDIDEFLEHFRFLVPELWRVTKPGRLMSFHCMLLPTSKARDGFIGLSDFRGSLIRAFVGDERAELLGAARILRQRAGLQAPGASRLRLIAQAEMLADEAGQPAEQGWIHHSEVVIWKDPVTAMQRTKALGLLHKQIKKDSSMSRQGIPDYLITMRKPGDNAEPVSHTDGTFPVGVWQRYASPVWMDINPSDTLQFRSARQAEDERHICPLQLQVIDRAIELWTNPGDVVLSPFAGIGSEGYVAVRKGRRFVGVELKESYYQQAVLNLRAAERQQAPLFADLDAEPVQ